MKIKSLLSFAYKILTLITFVVFLVLLFCSIQIFIWSLDDQPPFKLIDYELKSGYPGEVITIKSKVIRDVKRKCSVTYSRSFSDSAGTRTDLTSGKQIMSAKALTDLNERSPDRLSTSVSIPVNAEKGEALIITVLEYECNPFHKSYPIDLIMKQKLLVL